MRRLAKDFRSSPIPPVDTALSNASIPERSADHLDRQREQAHVGARVGPDRELHCAEAARDPATASFTCREKVFPRKSGAHA